MPRRKALTGISCNCPSARRASRGPSAAATMRITCAPPSTRHWVSAAASTRSSEAPPPPVRALNPAQKHRLTGLSRGQLPQRRRQLHRRAHKQPHKQLPAPQLRRLPRCRRPRGRSQGLQKARRAPARRSRPIRTRNRRTTGTLPHRNPPTLPDPTVACHPMARRPVAQRFATHRRVPPKAGARSRLRSSRAGDPSPMHLTGRPPDPQVLQSLPLPLPLAHRRRARRRRTLHPRKLPRRRG